MSNDDTPSLLIVDDSEGVRAYLQRLLTQAFNIAADAVASPREAIRLVQQGKYCCLITDLEMPEIDGVSLLQAIHKSKPHIRAALLTGSNSPRVEEARAVGADVFFKPVDRLRLIEWIRGILPR
jgi:CheY-like chemotaxis protein